MTSQSLHASAFAYHGIGCVILGESGIGKSRVLAQAILHGAEMIADDQVLLRAVDGQLLASAPATLTGVLELRGLGLIRHAFIASHPVHIVITLDVLANERLPEPEMIDIAGIAVRHARVTPVLSVAALLLYVQAVHENRTLPTDWRPVR